MTLVILGEAEREFAESIAYYESKEAGLGWRVRSEVIASVEGVGRNSTLPRPRAKGSRRRNLHAFPLYIAYVIRDETIWIVAIAHAYRRPEFWMERI